MPKGVTQYKGNYVTNQATTTTYTGTTATNDSVGSSAPVSYTHLRAHET